MVKVFQQRTEQSKDNWETPLELFNPLNALYDFNIDAAATKENSLCIDYLKDAFTEDWDLGLTHRRVWCNPPFSQKVEFLERMLCYIQVLDYSFFLLPNNSRETFWWNEFVVPYADLIINLVGRVNFCYKGKPSKQCNFPSCLAVFRPRLLASRYGVPREIYWNWKEEPCNGKI